MALGFRMPRIRVGLLTRIVVALAATGLLPVAFVSYRLVDLNRDALFSQVLQTHAVAARTTAERVEAFVAGFRTIAETVAKNPEIAADPRSPESAQLLQDLMTSRADIAAVAVVNLKGETLLRAQRRDAADLLPEILDSSYVEPFVVRRVADRVWLVENLPLEGGGGYLRLVVDADSLAESINPEEIGEDANIAVVDRSRAVVMGSVASADAFPTQLVTDATAGRGTKGARRYAAKNGEVVLGAFAPVVGTPWAVISVQPGHVAEAMALSLRRRALIAIGVALVLIALVAIIAWGSFVRPIRQMLMTQRRLASLPVEEKGDELAQLRASLEALERRVQDRAAMDDIFLGRYRVLDILGEGGMGTVFRGWDPKLQREIALKTIHLGAKVDPDRREQMLDGLLHEAVTVARMSNPNVVAVFDIEDSGDAAFVAMEIVDGESLERYLQMHGRLDPAHVVPLGAAIANGLAAAHRAGVVHQDVKPANVLLGQEDSIKVTDFGIAAMITSAQKKKGTVFGTPGYIAPEAISEARVEPAGDLFSLGVILYRALAGDSPFTRSSVRKTLLATLHEDPPPLDSIVKGLDPQIERIVLRLLEKDPFRRIREADALATELGEIAIRRRWSWKYRTAARKFDNEHFRTTVRSEMLPTITVSGPSSRSGAEE